MCCCLRKSLELLGMLCLCLFGLFSLLFALLQWSLSLAFLSLTARTPSDYAFGLWGLLVAATVYIVALACLTATVRMVRICDRLLACWVPLYARVRDLKKNHRIMLLMVQMVQLSYQTQFHRQYYDSHKQVYIGAKDDLDESIISAII